MRVTFLYGRTEVVIRMPDDTIRYASSFPAPAADETASVMEAVNRPIGAPPLVEALARRRKGPVVIVVSDATRPVPYARFLPNLLALVESAGVPPEEMIVLVATGMHRPSTAREREAMFGPDLPRAYRIIDHRADDAHELVELPKASWSGNRVRLNRTFVNAGFRLITGLVEPHFMAGFSGGRKAVCPGLVSPDTVRRFHGNRFLSNPLARNGNLAGNPCHAEALSMARLAGVDFSLNVVVNRDRRVVGAFAGELEAAHEAACGLVRKCACRDVPAEADAVLTSSGGSPLDATFYQCVKGFVSCLPAVKREGVVIAFGSCSEGIGSNEYAAIMAAYAGRWREFLAQIQQPDFFVKDQWQFQMQARALEHVGERNLRFITSGLPREALARLSVNGTSVAPDAVTHVLQAAVDELTSRGGRLAAFPEGPYCVPLRAETPTAVSA